MIVFLTNGFPSHLTSAWFYLTAAAGLPCRGKISFQPKQIICRSAKKKVALNLLLEIPGFGKVMAKTKTESSGKINLIDSLIIGRLEQIHAEFNSCRAEEIKINPEVLAEFKTLSSQKNNLEKLSSLMHFGEKLTLVRAKQMIIRKKLNKEFNDFLFGCQAFGIKHGRLYKKLWLENFDLGTIPLYFFLTERSKNSTDWRLADSIMRWLKNNHKQVKGHPLVWLHRLATPEWIKAMNFSELKTFIAGHIKKTVSRFKNEIKIWDVINEPAASDANGLNLNLKQLLEITKLAGDMVKAVQPECHRIINLSDIFSGKSWIHHQPPVPAFHFLSLCQKNRIEFEGIGLQFYMGMRREFACRDLLSISQQLDQFCRFGKALHLSELGWPSKHDVDPDCFFGADHPEVAGRWHRPWSEQLQADFLTALFSIFASKPFARSITWWDFTDKGTNLDIGSRFIPFGGLTRADLSPKSALLAIKSFKEKICSR